MARPDHSLSSSRMLVLASTAFVVAALYFARDILMPLALAVLLSFLFAPLVTRLQRHGLGRIPSVLVVVVGTFLAFGAIGFVVAEQVVDLTGNLPGYKDNLSEKIHSLKGPSGRTFRRASETLSELAAEVSEEEETSPATPAATQPLADEPVPVKVVGTATEPTVVLGEWLGPLVAPLGVGGMVIVLVIFILIKREDLRNRVIRLVGEGQLHITTRAMDDAAARISRYLLMQFLINVSYGVSVAIGTYILGVPNALLWGLLATVFRFVPYIGPWAAAALPIVLSLAVFDGWTRPLMLISLFILLELVINNVIEPWLYGSSTGVSAVGIIVSAIFWTWLWGGMGLVLATPMTVCLTVAARYVPQMRFLNILFSDEPVLAIEARFYQRLLAMDLEEASDLVDEALAESSLADVYETMLIPALSLAEHDRHAGRLPESQQQFIQQAMRDIIEDLGDRETPPAGHEQSDAVRARRHLRVMCLPARDEADELVALMFSHLLASRGYTVDALTTDTLSGEMVDAVSRFQADFVVISALPPFAALHARYRVKRLRPALPDVPIVVGIWNSRGKLSKTRQSLGASGADEVATSLNDALDRLQHRASHLLLARQHAAGDRPADVESVSSR